MTNLLFHERCNDDITRLTDRFSNTRIETKKNFHLQLINSYQLIYENPNCGERFHQGGSSPGAPILKYLHLQQFDCLVIYQQKEHRVVVVLGVFPIQRSWSKR